LKRKIFRNDSFVWQKLKLCSAMYVRPRKNGVIVCRDCRLN
jgi:hypothetical protein